MHQCGRCGKRFAKLHSVRQHIRDKHKGHGAPVHGSGRAPDAEDESFADRAIAAQIDHALGVDNPDYDWLVEPFN